jgi:radical SAM protein with 4Fe4S-binding SPASM domain
MFIKRIINMIHKTYYLKKIVYFGKNVILCIFQYKKTSRKINFFKNSLSCLLGLKRSLGTPMLLCIEPTNVCDQQCTICETGLGTLGRKKEFLTFYNFTSIINQFNDNLEILFFYFMGEPFLNGESYRMIQYASRRGIWVSACTNGNQINPPELMKSGIGEINFQIGGMTQEIHEIYRKGGDLKKVFTSIEECLHLRNQLFKSQKTRPMINICFILMKHNEHQVPAFIEYCKNKDVDRYEIIGTCLREYSQGAQLLPTDTSYWLYDEKSYNKGVLIPKYRPNNYCEWIYFTTTIQVNGDVVPCCRDTKGKFILGNVFNQEFFEIWNNQKYQEIRNTVAKQSNVFTLCKLCSAYMAPIENPALPFLKGCSKKDSGK